MNANITNHHTETVIFLSLFISFFSIEDDKNSISEDLMGIYPSVALYNPQTLISYLMITVAEKESYYLLYASESNTQLK
jgi:hypothetical protein